MSRIHIMQTKVRSSWTALKWFFWTQEDQNYLIHHAGLQDVIRPEWKNPAKGRTTAELVASYYSQLTTAQILQLYHIYR
jgi:hypothetical protein